MGALTATTGVFNGVLSSTSTITATNNLVSTSAAEADLTTTKTGANARSTYFYNQGTVFGLFDSIIGGPFTLTFGASLALSTIAFSTATSITSTAANSLTLNRTDAAGVNGFITFNRASVSKVFLGLNASDIFTIYSTALAQTLTLSDAGLLTILAGVRITDGGLVSTNTNGISTVSRAGTAGPGLEVTHSSNYGQIRIISTGSNLAAYLTLNGSGSGKGVIQFNDTDKITIDSAGVTFADPITGSFIGAVTGNASTATKLQTARNINGVAFDGTANITVTADASTLTNTTLAAAVVASSLTSVGTLTSLVTNSLRVATGAIITKILSATVVWDIPSTLTGAFASTTVTVTGAAVGDVVIISQMIGTSGSNGYIVNCYVSSADTVTIIYNNLSGSTQDPASATYRVIVFHI